MKRVLLMVFSIILILACIFGLFACVAGVRDVLNINDYKKADAAFARENLETARAGIAQLKENEETYLTGVGTYTDGLSQYTKGLSDYAAGKATLAAGEKTLAEGYAAYEAGKKKLAEGQAIIDANTQAYNEGKEKLAKIEPLLPYLNQYVQFRDGTIAKLPGFDSAQAWFVSVVRPIASKMGLNIPADVTDFPAYINQMVADGKAQLKAYEDGLAELEAGKKQLAEAEKQSEERKSNTMVHDTVTEEEIANIVAKWTGIPVAKLREGEREKILHLGELLHKRVIGQDEAVQKVTEAILRSRAGIADPNRPIGSFLFLGPTGVGKTELAKSLAECLFDDEHNIVRIDMTEYMEKFSVSRLIGAPPGYVGYDEGGQLTEAVRRKPYSVVLFDEIEKAHPDVFNILLQILDDGRITDSQGRTVDFKNTIIILTSNLGSQYLLDGIGEDGEISQSAKDAVMGELRRAFRPEFLNRLDETIMFHPLTKANLGGIIDIMVESLRKRLADRALKLDITDAAKQLIISRGYDPLYGARPLRRYLQASVETLIARTILSGELSAGATITVDAVDGELVCR